MPTIHIPTTILIDIDRRSGKVDHYSMYDHHWHHVIMDLIADHLNAKHILIAYDHSYYCVFVRVIE